MRGIDRRSVLRGIGTLGVGATALSAGLSTSVAADRELDWQYDTGAWIRGSPSVVDDTVYAGTTDGRVVALDAAGGEERWRTSVGGRVTRGPAVSQGTVYVPTAGGEVVALGAADGSVSWTTTTGAALYSAPTVVGDTLYQGVSDGSIAALDVEDGSKRWQRETGAAQSGGPVGSSPTVVDGTIFVGSSNGDVYAIDAETGQEVWSHPTAGPVRASPTFADGRIVAPSSDGVVYCLSAEDGEQLWRHNAGAAVLGSPTVVDDVVTVGNESGILYRIDLADGSERLKKDLIHPIHSGPTEAEGIVMTAVSNYLTFTEVETGDIVSVFSSGFNVATASPILVDGTVYYAGGRDRQGTQEGVLAAIDVESEGSSADTRVRLGTLGHDDRWAEAPAARHLAPTIDETAVQDGAIVGQATVTNEGTIADEDDVVVTADGTEIEARTVSLGPGASTTVTFSYDLAAGDGHEVEIAVAGDETATRSVAVEPVSLSLSFDDAPDSVKPDDNATVAVVVEKTGDIPAEPAVEFSANGTTVDTATVELAAGEDRATVEFNWTAPGDGGDVELAVAGGNDSASQVVTLNTTSASGPGFGPVAGLAGIGGYAAWRAADDEG